MADVAEYGKWAGTHHRIRLTDRDMDVIASALRQRLAGRLSEVQKEEVKRLLDRFIEREAGRH
jgi:hypothetical protein